MLRLFQGSFIFGEATSSQFFRLVLSTQQLPFQSSCFFRAFAFLTSSFLLYLQKSYFFEAGTSAQHQLFQKSYILEKCAFFRKAIFCITHFFRKATFLERLLFQDVMFYSTYLSKRATFLQHNFSEQLLFYNIIFQNSYFFTT